jgi:hypothetical protein
MSVDIVCSGCGKNHKGVIVMVAVNPAKDIFICNECIELCVYILHEKQATTNNEAAVMIPLTDLDRLRKSELQLSLTIIWVNAVRDAIVRADAEVAKGATP